MLKIDHHPGERYGRLTLLRENGHDRWGGRQFLFRCDCGNEVTVRWGITSSCGCLQREAVINVTNVKKRLKFGESGLNHLYSVYRLHARHKKREFALTHSEFRNLVVQPCHYCNVPPSSNTKGRGFFGSFAYSGLDRMNNTRGYTLDTVVPCCGPCNIAKHTMSYEAFKQWVKSVYENFVLR